MSLTRDEATRWAAYLRLLQPFLARPDSFGCRYMKSAFGANLGWVFTLLPVDGPAVTGARLANMGIPCPVDVKTPF